MSSPRGTGWVTMRRTPERPMDEELRMILETESKTYHTSQNILYVEVRERGEGERERERGRERYMGGRSDDERERGKR